MSIEIARSVARVEKRLQYVESTDPQKRTLAPLASLPFIRAGWTMGFIDYQNPRVCDVTGMGYRLTDNNGPTYGFDLSAPYVEFNGANQWLNRADGGAANWADILGTEAYVPANLRGLTFGGWFYFDRLTNQEFLIAKDNAVAAGSSYRLEFRGDLANDPFRFVISNGAAFTTVTHTLSKTVETSRWYYVVGRYDPGTETKIYLGAGDALESSTNVVAIPAALNDSAADLTIGAQSGGGLYLDGRASCCFLCAGYLSDAWVRCLYSQLREVFRV